MSLLEPPMPPTDPDLSCVAEIGERFRDAFERGENPRIEDFLPAGADVVRSAALLELLKLHIILRRAASEAAHVEDYLGRFPEVSNSDFRRRVRNGLPTDGEPPPPTTLLNRNPVERAELRAEFGRYRDVRLLHRGHNGVVYVAEDPATERVVALLVPRFDCGDPDLDERFVQEARAAARLHHPNLCPVYEAGFADGIPYFTMAHLAGKPLTVAYLPPLPARRAAELVRRLALALAEAHRHGVVHGDLQPAAVIVDVRGEPVITEFGLAAGRPVNPSPYRAPEADSGPPADVFALGAIFYELLTGTAPAGPTPTGPRQIRPELDPRLERVCLTALGARPADRFSSMTEFATALADWLDRDAGLATVRDTPEPAVPPDPKDEAEALAVFRTNGWDCGLSKLRTRLGDSLAGPALLSWLTGDRTATGAGPDLTGWALAGQAFLALRERDRSALRRALDAVAAVQPGPDKPLAATLAHLRGAAAQTRGDVPGALAQLHTALELFGPDHSGAGSALDTLGLTHAARGDFALALAYYGHALKCKRRYGDEAGAALTHGRLGRLYLDWGKPDEADHHFRSGLALARRTGDARGTAQLSGHRGQVLLAQGRVGEAAALLDESIQVAAGRWPVVEAFARKDRAVAHRSAGELDAAEAACLRAAELFETAGYAEGLAHALRVLGMLRRDQGRLDESADALTTAAGHFDRLPSHAEAARSRLELARTLRASAAPVPRVAAVLGAALDSAERGRRDDLAAELERRLRNVAPRELLARLDRGGRDGFDGRTEQAAVLALELRTTDDEDPGALLAAANHLFADLEPVWEVHGLSVVQTRGDGLLALARGPHCAGRVVAAALDVAAAIAEANRPRRVLGWAARHLAAGVAAGPVGLGRAGLTRPADAVAVGPPVRRADGLRSAAGPGQILVCAATRPQLGDGFELAPAGPVTGAWRVIRAVD